MNISFEDIPKDLQRSAIWLRNEVAWELEDALKLIDWLSSMTQMVVGVEIWHVEGDSPMWIATSNFDCIKESQNVFDYANSAKEFVTRFGEDQQAIFNIDWEGANQT